MIVQLPNLKAILNRHKIHPKFWPGLHAFLEQGVPPDDELAIHLRHEANYKSVVAEVLRAIKCEHTFAPEGYHSPVPYESLRREDIENVVEFEAATSAGAPSAARLAARHLRRQCRVGKPIQGLTNAALRR